MRLIRHGSPGAEKPGLIDGSGRRRDLSGHIDDIRGEGLRDLAVRLATIDAESLPAVADEGRLGVPLCGIGKAVCIGLNYRDHAAEVGHALPEEPIVFFKPVSAASGPNDPVVLLRESRHGDWEVELAAVIGRDARYVEEERALDHVFGYCLANDVSERRFQAKGSGQWVLGKSGDSHLPLGPWLATRDEIADPQALRLWLEVNGERMQDGTTADMIFGVARLVSFVSRFMTLEAGDLLLTGTPAGTGMGRRPRRFLRAGDRIRAGGDGLGEQRCRVAPPAAPAAGARAT